MDHHPRKHTADAAIQQREGALVIFGKAPIPGQVKTRLCPPLTPDEAATVHGGAGHDRGQRVVAAYRQHHGPSNVVRQRILGNQWPSPTLYRLDD